MKEVTIRLNEFALTDRATGRTMSVQTVLTLEELYSLITENEKDESSWKVQDALGKLYGCGEDEG